MHRCLLAVKGTAVRGVHSRQSSTNSTSQSSVQLERVGEKKWESSKHRLFMKGIIYQTKELHLYLAGQSVSPKPYHME